MSRRDNPREPIPNVNKVAAMLGRYGYERKSLVKPPTSVNPSIVTPQPTPMMVKDRAVESLSLE